MVNYRDQGCWTFPVEPAPVVDFADLERHPEAMNETPAWRKSTYSGYDGECVEVAKLPYGEIAMRDSKRPHGGMLRLSRKQFAEWVAGAADGEFDDLT